MSITTHEASDCQNKEEINDLEILQQSQRPYTFQYMMYVMIWFGNKQHFNKSSWLFIWTVGPNKAAATRGR